jgi:hypothetical protein
MIDPDFFGCSGKLSYDETRALTLASGRPVVTGDFSEIASVGRVVTSVDRVHRCAKDWNLFARIALNHAFGDVVCAGAKPVQAMLSFEFGIDAPASDRGECSSAFARELAARGISLGKCHSGYGSGVTAVTIATLATAPARAQLSLGTGEIYLSRPIGAFKLHYLSEMGVDTATAQPSDLLETHVYEAFHDLPWTHVTDVSGHGLLGAVAQAAAIYGLWIDLTLSAAHAVSPEVLSVPVECLQNPLSSYGVAMADADARATTLVTMRETAGPYLGFIEDGPRDGEVVQPSGLLVGRYRQGTEGIDISWSE